MQNAALIILDRDGVLNQMVVNADHGTVDSPLHPDQVIIDEAVPSALVGLKNLGFMLAVATNQPAAAKGKTTRFNLEATHRKVLELIGDGGTIKISSFICWHKSEDGCACRKPKSGLLEQALVEMGADPALSWMVGDGVTDIVAGRLAGVKTAFIGSRKADVCQLFSESGVAPDIWCADLMDFFKQISQTNGEKRV
jgi:histidinol-phosphate phosphatase family protein